ncbi:hypothetical protein HELRODRAFT_165211 [Helobdella robusta]|uniref:Uncharacterized protein n=1 Tax=Helobdella robusta TaxID=6412 RepID=T1EWG0_HELRO|nr:hypothetical protein HELRODRAFT_165211 [Helobdella robusta]ESN93053.1 hypothetical protein HELRODRAFT_165211 [Helobdella robusta]
MANNFKRTFYFIFGPKISNNLTHFEISINDSIIERMKTIKFSVSWQTAFWSSPFASSGYKNCDEQHEKCEYLCHSKKSYETRMQFDWQVGSNDAVSCFAPLQLLLHSHLLRMLSI